MKDYKWTPQEKREYDFISEWQDRHDFNPTYADAIAWADTHPNWIKITDKMPKLIDHCLCSVFVLITYKVQYMYLGEVRYTQVACYDYKEKGWFTHDDRQIDGDVTHWMPITLPKED